MSSVIATALRARSRAPLLARGIAYKGADHPFVIKSPAPDLVVPSPCPNFNDFITADFKSKGDRAAITVANPDGSVDVRTFADLLADVDSVANELRTQIGFKAGDTALIVSPNHADYFAAVHAVLKLGGVVTPANPLYTAHEICNQLKDSGATVLLTHPMCLKPAFAAVELLRSGGDERKVQVLVLGSEASSGATPFDALKGTGATVASLGPVADDALASLPYSSGTTGLPKGTMLTHRNLVANVLQYDYPAGQHWVRDEEVIISPLPFFHIYGFTASLNISLYYGCEVVTMPAFDMVKFLELLRDKKCTQAHLVPPIILGLAKHPIVDKFRPFHLKAITSGAAPLGKEVGEAAAARLECAVDQAWGMSELSPIGTVNPTGNAKPGTSGIPVAGMYYKVVDVETGELLPRGEEGEVVCAGPNVLKGYLNNPEANEGSFDADGWFRTGDIGKFDEDGYVTFTDRLKELIKYKGFQVPPAELEALLLTHPHILDAAVIARPDEEGGEVPVAFVVPKPESPEAEIASEAVAAWVAERVAPHKRLRGGVVHLETIPKSASGKILRRILVDRDRAGEFTK